MCWAVQEAARSGGEEVMCFSMGAQGGSRAMRMREGAAIRVALVYERVVSGRRVVGCAVLWRVAGRSLRVDSHLSDA